jgi:hypothetical protein
MLLRPPVYLPGYVVPSELELRRAEPTTSASQLEARFQGNPVEQFPENR